MVYRAQVNGKSFRNNITSGSSRYQNQISLVRWKKEQNAKIQLKEKNQNSLAETLVVEEDEKLNFIPLKNFWALTALALILILGIVAYTRINHQQVHLGIEVSTLNNRKMELLDENRRLKLELAKLTNLEDLELVAKRDLGLVSPKQGQIVIID